MRDKLAVWATTPWRLNRLARGGCGVLLGGVPGGGAPFGLLPTHCHRPSPERTT